MIHHSLFKMLLGVLVAVAVHFLTRKNGGVEDLKSEVKLLALPALAVAATYFLTGSGYEEVAEAVLISMATALGLNSGKVK